MNISIILLLFQVSMLSASFELKRQGKDVGATYHCVEEGLNKVDGVRRINPKIDQRPEGYEHFGVKEKLKERVQKGKYKVHDGGLRQLQQNIKSKAKQIRNDKTNDEYVQVNENQGSNMAAPMLGSAYNLYLP
ncbi:hypothetical protein DFH28DRAFT_961137 [Melampsora americana]|nr:hypothetical protein DFH28DRAFT_961137 [Melampsora americana]